VGRSGLEEILGGEIMSYIKIGVFNKSTVVSDAEVKKWVVAVQHQVRNEWAAAWGFDADIIWLPKDSAPRSNMWHLIILDDADQASALGYYDMTSEGLPQGKCFVKTALSHDCLPSVAFSQEVLEMLGDPDVNLVAMGYDPNSGAKFYAYEVCDAVDSDTLAYPGVNGVMISDFVTPAWFESFRTSKTANFSYRSSVAAPFQLAIGGHIGVYDPMNGWVQMTARHAYNYSMRAVPGSRRERRLVPRHQWMKTTATPFKDVSKSE
jgi:hypothetical protein